MNAFWFKAKATGFGMTPVTWEGYALVTAMFLVALACAIRITLREKSGSTFKSSMAVIAASAIVFLAISAQMTDWRRGENAGPQEIAGKSE